MEPIKVACVQAEPVVLDREATLDKLADIAGRAAREGARLLVFPEAFIPAYPSSAWAKAFAGWADPRAKAAFALLRPRVGGRSRPGTPTGSARSRASTASGW